MDDNDLIVTKKGRETCWKARDEYHLCLIQHKDNQKICLKEYEYYIKVCPKSWVKHFEEKREYTGKIENIRKKYEIKK